MPGELLRIPTLAAGLALGVAFTLSPLTVISVAAFAYVAHHVARTLPADERWWFVRLLAVAFALRLAAIAALCLAGPHDRQGAGILFGDEAYALTRSWRLRNVLLDVPQLKYDYMTAFDEYGRSSYIWVMTYLQVLTGPSPYGLRALNAAMFLGAALLLFRMTRRAFGAFAAFAGLTILTVLPTLFFWSISLLKESFYFVLTVAVLAATVEFAGAISWRRRVASAATIAVALFLLRDLRNGAVAIAVAGIAIGAVAAIVLARGTRIVAALAAVAVALAAVIVVPSLQRRAIASVESAAVASAGHVFTVGHGYKLLDEGFYVEPTARREYQLTPAEAGRYVVRAALTYVVTPLPWQIETRGELSYLPEQLLWYVLLLSAPFGAIVAVRRDRVVAALLIAYVLPTAAVVALTTGNVGTLIRHRTLIVPYIVWVSALGLGFLAHAAVARRERPAA
jgi:hypothetical protein